MRKNFSFEKKRSSENSSRRNTFPAEKFKLTFPLAIAIVAVQLIVLFVIGFFLFDKFFSSKSLAKFLPAEQTLGFVEVTIDENQDQFKRLLDQVKGYPVYQKENLEKLLSFPISDFKELQKWLGRKAGLAFVKFPQGTHTQNAENLLNVQSLQLADFMNSDGVSPVFFVEFKNYDEALNYLKSRILQSVPDQIIEDQFEGHKLISFKLGLYYKILVIDNYFIITDSFEALSEIAAVKNKKIPSLASEQIFVKASNALPKNGLGFAYVNTQKAWPVLMQNEDLMSMSGKYLTGLFPFMKIFSAEAFSFIFDEGKLKLYQTTVIDKEKIGNVPYLHFEKKYLATLLEGSAERSLIVMAGRDLKQEYERLSELFGTGNKASQLIFQGFIEDQKNKYFDENIDAQKDILSLLEGEYAIYIDGSWQNPEWSFVVELLNPASDLEKVQKLKTSFLKKAIQWAPKVEEFTLPDGTKGKEVVADASKVTEEKIDYNYGQEVYQINLGSSNKKIYYGIVQDKFIAASSLENLDKAVVSFTSENHSNKKETQNPMLKDLNHPDEVITLDFNALLDEKSPLKKYFEPFSTLKIGRSYFDDGIATTFVLEFAQVQ